MTKNLNISMFHRYDLNLQTVKRHAFLYSLISEISQQCIF